MDSSKQGQRHLYLTSVKTEEAVDHDRQGTTGTGFGHRAAAREQFWRTGKRRMGKGEEYQTDSMASRLMVDGGRVRKVTYMSPHGESSESNWPQALVLQPVQNDHALQDKGQSHHKQVGHVVQLGTPVINGTGLYVNSFKATLVQ